MNNSLYQKLSAIGFRVLTEPTDSHNVDIEETIYLASIDCVNDGRLCFNFY